MEDGFCESIFAKRFRVLGLLGSKGRWKTYLALVIIVSMSFALGLNIVIGDRFVDEAAHFLVISNFYTGLLISLIYYRTTILELAKQVDSTFFHEVEWTVAEFKRLGSEPWKTTSMKLTKMFWVWLVAAQFIMTVVVISKRAFTGVRILPIPIYLPSDEIPVYVALVVYQVMFMYFTSHMCIFLLEIYASVTNQLCVHFQLLAIALNRIEPEGMSEPDLIRRIEFCIQYHLNILRLYNQLKSIYEPVFHVIYFGTAWAIALSRGIVSSVDDNWTVLSVVGILVAEIFELFIYSFAAETVIKASEDTRLAIYTCKWYDMPLSCKKCVLIMLTRTIQEPKMSFFVGGSAVSLDTFQNVLNATTVFFLLVFISQ